MSMKKEWKSPLLVLLFTAYFSGMFSLELPLALAPLTSSRSAGIKRKRERAMSAHFGSLAVFTNFPLLRTLPFNSPPFLRYKGSQPPH